MKRDPMAPTTEGQLANVAAVLLIEREGDPSLGASLLGEICQDVHWAALAGSWNGERLESGDGSGLGVPEARALEGPASVLRSLARALATAPAERVLVTSTRRPPSASELLALTAWPEADAVIALEDGRRDPLCGIYRRDAALEAARAELARRPGDPGRPGVDAWLERLEVAEVGGSDLGRE